MNVEKKQRGHNTVKNKKQKKTKQNKKKREISYFRISKVYDNTSAERAFQVKSPWVV